MAKKKKAKPASKKRKPAKKKVRAAKKAPARKKAPAKLVRPAPTASSNEKVLGEVEDFFARINVIALKLKGPIALGEKIRVRGHTTDFIQEVRSMQIDHKPVTQAKRGDSVGIQVGVKARKGDDVLKVPS